MFLLRAGVVSPTSLERVRGWIHRMENRKTIIIGAGVAGLCTGIYARLNGYETEIYEAHAVPGGLCAGWNRSGYTIDGCVHWLLGASPSSPFHRYWTEVGVLPSTRIDVYDEFLRTECEDGRTVVLHADADRLAEHLTALSPDDSGRISELVRLIKTAARMPLSLDKPVGLMTPREILGLVRSMSPFGKEMSYLTGTSIGEFARDFRHPGIRRALCAVIPPDHYLLALVFTLADYHARNAGFPAGGSLGLARTLADRYRALGGVLHPGRRVRRVLTMRRGLGSAVRGILLEDGTEIAGDTVVSAADGRTTIYDFLGGAFRNRKIDALYKDPLKYRTYTSLQVSFGVDADLSKEPGLLDIPMSEPLCIGDRAVNRLLFKVYRPEWGLAPAGKTVVACGILTSYEHWNAFRSSRGAYAAEKNRIARAVRRELEHRFPAAAGRIEVTDVATPLTYERYTGVWRGAYMAWMQTPLTGRIQPPDTLPGLKNFYMAGMWALPAGLPVGAVTGRWVVQKLCRRDRREFRTEPEIG